MNDMGGGYASAGTASYLKYGDRPGALLVATCVDAVKAVVFQAWTLDGAGNAENDEARLHTLWQGGSPPAVSMGATGLPKIDARERIEQLSAATSAKTCQSRAQKALATLAEATPALKTNPWSHLIGNIGAAAGANGTTASITCLDGTAYAVLDTFTIAPDVDPDAVLNALATSFQNSD
jgi:hypothetical protein